MLRKEDGKIIKALETWIMRKMAGMSWVFPVDNIKHKGRYDLSISQNTGKDEGQTIRKY